VTPCLLPLLLIITSLIGSNAESTSKRKAFAMSLTYVISLASTYAIAGIIAATFGLYLQGFMQNPWILGTYSLIFVLLGFSLFGFYNFQLPAKWRQTISRYSSTRKSSTYVGVALMGVLATLIASPCVAAPLAAILAYIAETGNVYLGAIALFATGIGIGTPVLIVSVVGIELLQSVGCYQKYVKQFFGIILIGMAIWLASRVLSASITMTLWAALVIFTALYAGALDRTPDYTSLSGDKTRSRIKARDSVIKTFNFMLLVYGSALLVGAIIGNTNPLKPLENIRGNYSLQAKLIKIADFIQLKNKSDVDHIMTLAREQKKPVLILFTAAWCTSCKEIEENIIPDNDIQKQLKDFILATVDLSVANQDIKFLTDYFHIAGPPVIIIYNKGAKPAGRIDGNPGKTTILRTLLIVR
jgi:thiol:disulfide interchange protein DsbD